MARCDRGGDCERRLVSLSSPSTLADVNAREYHPLFENRIEYEEFVGRLRVLNEDELGRFVRACHVYRKARNLGTIEPDVSMALLCPSIESTHSATSSILFSDWLIRDRLGDLENRPRSELRSILNRLYREYVDSEPEREGASYNFRRFLLRHCPENLRAPPMTVFPRGESPRNANFGEGLGYVYSKFRSLFLHEGKGRLETSPSDRTVVYSDLADVYRGTGYTIDMLSVLRWFSTVVLESLWSWFLDSTQRRHDA
jgi:hypothetical protein